MSNLADELTELITNEVSKVGEPIDASTDLLLSGIVDSLVKDLITPIVGLIGGAPDFSALKIGPVGLGNFINAVIAFLFKAAGLYFLIIVPFSRFAAKMAAAQPLT